MKISVYIAGRTQPQSGYMPVSLEELNSIDAGSIQELVLANTLDYFPNTAELLSAAASKLQYGGKIIIEGTNIDSILRANRYGEINSLELNQLLYNGKQSVVSNRDIVSILQQLGLIVIQNSLAKYSYIVVGERPQI